MPEKCRLRKQRQARSENAEHVFRQLHAHFNDPRLDLVCKANLTGELFPRGNLKKTQQRKMFRFAASCTGRFFTRKLCKMVVRKLLQSPDLDLRPPRSPSESWAQWAERQLKRLQQLASRAKRLTMDDWETQPMSAEQADALKVRALQRHVYIHIYIAYNIYSSKYEPCMQGPGPRPSPQRPCTFQADFVLREKTMPVPEALAFQLSNIQLDWYMHAIRRAQLLNPSCLGTASHQRAHGSRLLGAQIQQVTCVRGFSRRLPRRFLVRPTRRPSSIDLLYTRHCWSLAISVCARMKRTHFGTTPTGEK